MEKKLYGKLRQASGLANADEKELYNMINYIDWASRSDIKLNFDLTEEEMKCVEICIESVVFNDLGVFPD